MKDMRYFRWRTAIHKPIWAFDRHWYEMFGHLYVLDHPELQTAPNVLEHACPTHDHGASFGEVKPDGG